MREKSLKLEKINGKEFSPSKRRKLVCIDCGQGMKRKTAETHAQRCPKLLADKMISSVNKSRVLKVVKREEPEIDRYTIYLEDGDYFNCPRCSGSRNLRFRENRKKEVVHTRCKHCDLRHKIVVKPMSEGFFWG